ncbi:MAG TPA: hypothetical protein VK391_05395 [Allosphingosinicella sp.]|nr:hypothetical protein [Allosphingosinicella sp.]
MDQNHIAHESAFTPEAATYGSASSCNILPPHRQEFEFATEAEARAYWAGVEDGIASGGNMPALRRIGRAPDLDPDITAPADRSSGGDILDFDPVSLRPRIDGWTPQRQREYVEALADSGVAREAAARVGMSEQGVNRLRRRADARSFDRACDAALRLGARRLVSVGFERVIEGTIKRHYYRGEVVGEERVFDNRLLLGLIAKLPQLFGPPEEVDPVAANWEPWMQAIEQGLPQPPPPPPPEPPAPSAVTAADAQPDLSWSGEEIWEENGLWWTDFPPPPGFDGEAEGNWGDPGYKRRLSTAEEAAIEAEEAEERSSALADQVARRDLFFGFTPGAAKAEASPPTGCET